MAAVKEEGQSLTSSRGFGDAATAGKVDGPQQAFENGTREALIAFTQSIQATQQSTFAQVQAQLSQLTRENRLLRDQLGIGNAAAQDSSRPSSRATKPWVDVEVADVLDVSKPAKTSKPAGKCVVSFSEPESPDRVEAFTLPSALDAFTEPPQPRPMPRDAWNEARHSGEVLSGRVARRETVKDEEDAGCLTSKDSMMVLSDNRQMQRRQSVRLRASIKSASASVAQAERSTNAKRRFFPDKTDLMAKVQSTLVKPEYQVSDYYHETGFAQMVANHHIFETLTLSVIALNSVWIAIDADYNADFLEPPAGFVVVENLFCTFFFVELLIRFLAFDGKWHCLRDYWFIFDTILVSIAVLETWVMAVLEGMQGEGASIGGGSGSSILRLLRMARLAKTARMARLLRAVPEVMIMFKGIVVASHAVICTIFVLTIIIYIFALCFRQLTMDSALGQAHFRSVPSSMGTLLLRGTLPDFGPFLRDLSGSHILFASVGLGFVLLTALVVLNMLAGVLVNVVLLVADLEKEEADVVFVRKALGAILDLGDVDGDKTISKKEFEKLLVNPEATHLLAQVNVDVMGLVELVDFIFVDAKEGLDFDDFFKLLLSLRGSNNATVKDLVEVRKFIAQEISLLETYIGAMLKPVVAQGQRPSLWPS